jgi:hypothetical protein
VCLFDNAQEADDIIQKMYRALTDSPGKRRGFIVDLNPRRIFKAKFEYALLRNKSQKGFNKDTASEIIDYTFKANLWDCDAWKINEQKKGDFNTFMQDIKNEIMGPLERDLFKVFEEDVMHEDIKLLDGKPIDKKLFELLQGKIKGKTKTYQDDTDEISGKKKAEKSEKTNNVTNDTDTDNEDDEESKLIAMKRLSELTKQFINILIMRNSEFFSNRKKLEELMETYKTDEHKIKERLLTEDIDGCTENNIFYRVFSDLKHFISIPTHNVDGLLYVGAVDLGDERYSKIPPNAVLFQRKTKEDKYQKAIYNSQSDVSINTWASKVKGYGVNIFTDVEIADSDKSEILLSNDEDKKKISLGEYVAKYETVYESDSRPKIKSTLLVMAAIEERLKDKDVKILYSNYIESFINRMDILSTEIKYINQSGGQVSSDKRYNKVLKVIDEFLVPSDAARKDRGEVFTPPDLVRKMLYGRIEGTEEVWGFDGEKFNDSNEEIRNGGLPSDVWSNPNLKWLDPANGIGNFPVIAYYKLDYSLSKIKGYEEPDKRRKHIIENMLYMMELDGNNNNTSIGLFTDIFKGAKPNILCCNSLEITYEEIKKSFGVDKFDIIMGNPPYNSGGLLKGGGTLWPKFLERAFDMINPNGYIVFVHPPGWRKFYDPEKRDNQGKLWYAVRDNGWCLEYINVSDSPLPHFPVVDYYVIHAKKGSCKTKYDSLFSGIRGFGEAELNYPFIPNILNDETLRILEKIFRAKGDPIHIEYNQDFKPGQADKDIKTGVPHYHFTSRTGEKQIYKRHSSAEYINKSKVIMTAKAGYEKGRLLAFYSDEKLGTTNNSMYMLTKSKSQGDKLVEFFNSDIITFLMKITQYSAPPNHINEFKILNKLQVPDSMNSYDLTKEEKELIDKVIKESAAKNTTRKANNNVANNTTRKCPPRKERNPITGKCVNKCPKTRSRDPKTGKCVKPKVGGTRKIRY